MEDALKVAVVYQDSLMRAWALDMWERVSSSLKNETVLVQSWRMEDLTHPRVLPEAVAAGAIADILLVSLRASTGVPLALSVWVEGWLARRGHLAGTLVALLGTSTVPPVERVPAQQYLEAAARRAKLEFMPRQRALPTIGPPLAKEKEGLGAGPPKRVRAPEPEGDRQQDDLG